MVSVYTLLTTDIFISNSAQNLQRIGRAALQPTFSPVIIKNILSGVQNTLLFAIVGLCLGVYLGLLLCYLSIRFHRWSFFGKIIAFIFRSTHEIVFMYLLVLIFGLNPYIAIIAIGISFGGIMGKVFTDNMNLTDDHVIYAYKNRNYSYITNFIFNLFPKSFNSNLNYMFYRFECAIRSSIVLSYVGLPGIGFHLNNSLGDADYNSVFAYLYSLIILVLIFSILTSFTLKKLKYRPVMFVYLFIPVSFVCFACFLIVYQQNFYDLFNINNYYGMLRSFEAIKQIFNPWNTNLYSATQLLRFAQATWQTLVLGILGTVFMTILFFILIGHYLWGYVRKSLLHLKLNNIISIFNRSIPEAVFLILLLFVMKPNVVTGALALALHNFGILTKLVKDRIESNYHVLFATYRNRGYSSLCMLCFVFLPSLKRDLISLVSYRFEMMIKSSAVIGILGSGGLGLLIRLDMSRFNYQAIYFSVLIYILLFVIIDKANSIMIYQK